MDETSMRLPIRLLPRKGQQIYRLLFFIFFFTFAVFWIAMAATGTLGGHMQSEPLPGFRYAFPLFGLPFVLVGLVGIASAIAKMLPGSPFSHVEIAPEGITIRKPWKMRRFAWSQLSPFAVSLKARQDDGGRSTTYWVVALSAADTGRLAIQTERYNRSIVQIDAGEYAGGDTDMAASVLSDWLNQIRTAAVEHPGRLPSVVAVPPDFRDGAIELIAASVGAAAAKRSSVIER